MSDETNVSIKMEEQPNKRKAGRLRRWIGEKISGESFPERIQTQWDRIHQIGGFLPLYVEGRLELRTVKQEKVLNTIRKRMTRAKTFEDLKNVMFKSNLEVFALFFTTGTQWLRGLADRETAFKVKCLLEEFQRCIDNPSFTMDLFTCSMQMLNISWKPEDVTRLPPYLIETKTVIQPEKRAGIDPDVLKIKEY